MMMEPIRKQFGLKGDVSCFLWREFASRDDSCMHYDLAPHLSLIA